MSPNAPCSPVASRFLSSARREPLRFGSQAIRGSLTLFYLLPGVKREIKLQRRSKSEVLAYFLTNEAYDINPSSEPPMGVILGKLYPDPQRTCPSVARFTQM
ncbi:hypothetical protein NDU88_007619 [Pleurodeles waltl]|uniref:Uncharacterized protein n=1 Tax=Pleurodeles waltl TaxID=8319 RepID=A0AAV7PLY2_PLEWA|nr:hypothetical protein NDU88_007619 [Pleurodeles waltl]